MEKTGKAYGFIKCNKPKAQIEDLLPQIRENARTPSNLELSVIEGIEKVKGDKLLHRTVIKDLAEKGECNYVFEAQLNGADNETTARELKDIFNASYNSQLFVPRPSKVYGTVVYRQGNEYLEVE